jgi:hypothetical protein
MLKQADNYLQDEKARRQRLDTTLGSFVAYYSGGYLLRIYARQRRQVA